MKCIKELKLFKTDSKHLLIQLAQRQTGVRLLDIPDYQTVPITTRLSDSTYNN